MSGCFMYPLKIKLSSSNAVETFEVVYDQKSQPCKISSQSVHKWFSTSTLKFMIFRIYAKKNIFGRLLFYPSSFDKNNVYIMKQDVWHQHYWKLWSLQRICAEYKNVNQTRNARCGAALNVSSQQPASAAESRVFHVPPKNFNFIVKCCWNFWSCVWT